jgi:hypothetical protein
MKRFLLLAVLLASCGRSYIIPESETRMSVDSNYDAVFSSVVTYCAINSIPITFSDKSSGVISTGWSRNPFAQNIFEKVAPIRYNFTIRKNESASIVYAVLTGRDMNGGSFAYSGEYSLKTYRGMFAQIDSLRKHNP